MKLKVMFVKKKKKKKKKKNTSKPLNMFQAAKEDIGQNGGGGVFIFPGIVNKS